MRTLAFDPGLDITGWAVLDTDNPRTLSEALEGLEAYGEIVTSPREDLGSRLHSIHQEAGYLYHFYAPDTTIIEEPAYSGDYGNDKARRKSTNKMYMSIGVLLSVTHEAQLERIGTTKKAVRHLLLQEQARIAGVELPVGPRGGRKEDTMDAIWLACQRVL